MKIKVIEYLIWVDRNKNDHSKIFETKGGLVSLFSLNMALYSGKHCSTFQNDPGTYLNFPISPAIKLK